MKLVFKDPHCSGIKAVDCNNLNDIENVLELHGCGEEDCGGETIYYVFIDSQGNTTYGDLDFS